MIRVQIPGAPPVDVRTEDREEAARSAADYFRQNFPQQFSDWSRTSQPIDSFTESAVAGARGTAGAAVGAGEAASAALGAESLRDAFGVARQYVTGGGDANPLTRAPTLRDLISSRALEAARAYAGQGIGSVAGTAGGALIGAGVGGVTSGPAGILPGAATGALAAGRAAGVGELYQGLVEEGIDPQLAGVIAVPVGYAIGRIETRYLDDFLQNQLRGRVDPGIISRLSQRLVGGRESGIRATAAAGAISEAGGEALRQATIAAATGNPNLAERAERIAEEGLVGAFPGAAMGGVNRIRGRAGERPGEVAPTPEEAAAHQADIAAAAAEETAGPAPAPATETTPEFAPLVGERPAPFATPGEAADYLAENPAPAAVRTPEAQMAWANARRAAAWENEVEAARPTALSEFTAQPAVEASPEAANETFFGNLTQAAATDQVNLTKFTPQQVASLALQQRGLSVKPAPAEVAAVKNRLDALARQNYIEQAGENAYRISTGAPTAAPSAQPATPQPVVDPGAPAVNAGPAVQAAVDQQPQAAAARDTLEQVATTGQPAFRTDPQTNANLWRAYALNAGPEVGAPVVQAARDIARARKKPLSLNEFNTLTNAWDALPTDADRAVVVQQAVQNARFLGAQRGPEVTAPTGPTAAATPPPATAPPPAPAPQAVPQPQPTPQPAPQPTTQSQPAPQPQPQPAPQPATAPEVQAQAEAAPQTEAAPEQAPREEVAEEVEQEAEGPPSEAIAEDTGPAAESNPADFEDRVAVALAGVLPPNAAKGRAIIAKATRDTFFNKFTRGFFSPILTMSKWRAEMGAASKVARFVLRRNNKYNAEVQNLLARGMSEFAPEQRAVMARRLEQSSRDQKPFDRAGLSPEMIAKMEDIQKAGQRVFDYYIEASIIKHYDPNEAKTPGERERLLQMWERNRGRGLSQISDAELRLASPEGFAAKQKLEALRNPFYLPFTTGGKTHFIAAYPKGPDGKRKPGAKAVAVVPLDPTPAKYKTKGAPDAEALARQELDARGFTSDKYYVMPAPVEFTRDKEVAQIRDSSDFLAGFVEKLNAKVRGNVEAQALLRDMMTALDKGKVQGILRPNQGILIPITPVNESSYLTTTVPQYYAGIGKIQTRRYTEHSFKRAIKDLNPADQAYWRDHRDYVSAPAEAAWISKIRTFNFHWFMGAALDTALLNATQVYTGTMALLTRDGGARGAAITQDTINQVFTRLKTSATAAAGRDMNAYAQQVAKTIARNPAEARALVQAAQLEVFNPILTTESGGISDVNIQEALRARGFKNPEAWQKKADFLVNISGLPQRTAETLNRTITFLAAYRLATERPEVIERANRLDDYNFKGPNAAFEYAVSRVDDSQLITTADDRALFMRAFPGAELVTQFMSYSFKMTEIWATQWRNAVVGMANKDPELAKAGAIGLLLYSAPVIAFAGVWGLPGAEFLREALEGMIRLIWKDVENFADDLRRALGDGFIARALTSGLPHASGIAATSQRMSVDPIPFEDLAGWTPLQILGPIGGSLVDMVINFAGYASQGDYFNAAAAFMPRVIGNALKGAGLAAGTGEYRTPRGNVIVTQEQIADIDRRHVIPVSVRQALGLPSPEIADLREAYRIGREISTQTRAYAESLNNRLARAETERVRALRENNPTAAADALAEYRRILEEHGRRNEAYEAAGELDKMYNPSLATIRRQAYENIYGRTSPEVMGRQGRPAVRAELQEVQRRYSQQ